MWSQAKKVHGYIPARYVLAFLSLLAYVTTMTAQLSLNMAIVAMVDPSVWRRQSALTTADDSCPFPKANGTDHQNTYRKEGGFLWDAQTQGLLLGAMFYGSVCTHVVGGRLAERFGGKWLFGFSILVPALLCFLIPTAARLGAAYLFAVRILQGFGEGVMLPASMAMLSVWAPVKERSTMAVFGLLGSVVGGGLTMAFAGYIASDLSLGGWPTVFYLAGALGCVWFMFWACLVHSSPEEHPRISQEELQYIQESLALERKTQVDEKIPWRRILTSSAFWSFLIFRTGAYWESNTASAALPLYLETALHVPIHKNGVLMGLLYPAAATGCLVGGLLTDLLRRKTDIPITTIYKGFAVVGILCGVICWILVPEVKCEILWVFVLLLSCKFFHTICIGSVQVIIVDMAPQFAGTLSGIVLTTSDCTGFLSPLLTGAITESDVSIERWSLVFYTLVGILIFGLLLFMACGSAELQPWARLEENTEKTPLYIDWRKKDISL